ncbi:MAG: hypothetical protein IT204_15835 [Fimbriimonadaceae bacterium]|nr:hypothetical protein [Fimbriimonadaceae bacterium]
MTQRDKREQRLWGSGRNITAPEAVAILEAAGFECLLSNHGHWRCRHARTGLVVVFPAAHGRENKLLVPYVKAIRQALVEVRATRPEGQDNAGSDDDTA